MGSSRHLPPPVTKEALDDIRKASKSRISGNVITHYETVLAPVGPRREVASSLTEHRGSTKKARSRK